MKLVIILVLLIMSVMVVVGTFLISSVTSYHIDDYKQQMAAVFTTDFIQALNDKASLPDGASQMKDMIDGLFGICRHRYIPEFSTF